MLEEIFKLFKGWNEQKPYQNEHACRLAEPGQFTSFRRQNNWRKHNGKRIDAIFGIKSGKTKLQAMRMPKDQWSVSEARNYCRKNNGRFDAAG